MGVGVGGGWGMQRCILLKEEVRSYILPCHAGEGVETCTSFSSAHVSFQRRGFVNFSGIVMCEF